MAVFVIADLHLSTAERTQKSMEVFGPRWKDYAERLRQNWCRLVAPQDTVVVAGDISWALTLEEALEDLRFLNALPGKKVLMKGNHDFWWNSLKKMNTLCETEGLDTLTFLHNSATVAEDFLIFGTRGWFYGEEGEAGEGDIPRLIAREALRLDLSLGALKKLQAQHPEKEAIAFFHFPPLWGGVACEAFTAKLEEAGIQRCYFGHIHGAHKISTTRNGVTYTLVAADALSFIPLHIPA